MLHSLENSYHLEGELHQLTMVSNIGLELVRNLRSSKADFFKQFYRIFVFSNKLSAVKFKKKQI